MELNQRLQQLRKSLKISQKEFSEKLGFKQSYYSDVENGKRPVSTKVIESLRSKFNVSSEWMYSGEGKVFLTDVDNESIPNIVSQLSPQQKIQLQSAGEIQKPLEWNPSFPSDYWDGNNSVRSTTFEKKLLLDIIENYKKINDLHSDLNTIQNFQFVLMNLSYYYFS